MTREWTEAEDQFLVFYARCLGGLGEEGAIAHLSRWDMNRPEAELRDRLALLRRERPDFVADLEAKADHDSVDDDWGYRKGETA